MNTYQEALNAFCRTLADKSAGGGVKSSSPAENLQPQDIAGVAVFLKDGRVAVFGGGAE